MVPSQKSFEKGDVARCLCLPCCPQWAISRNEWIVFPFAVAAGEVSQNTSTFHNFWPDISSFNKRPFINDLALEGLYGMPGMFAKYWPWIEIDIKRGLVIFCGYALAIVPLVTLNKAGAAHFTFYTPRRGRGVCPWNHFFSGRDL